MFTQNQHKKIRRPLKQLRDRTQDTYLRLWNTFKKDINKELKYIETADVQSYLDGLTQYKKLASGTVNKYKCAIRKYFKWEEKKELDYLYTPQIHQKEKELLSRQQVLSIFKSAKGFRNKLICRTLYSSALRNFELHDTNIEHLEDRTNMDLKSIINVTDGKGGFPGKALISNNLFKDIKLYCGNRKKGPLFISRYGRLCENQIYRIVRKAGEDAGIKSFIVGPHHLRHAYASHTYYFNGKDVKKVSTQLRHKSVHTTWKYIHSETQNIDKDDNIIDIIEKKTKFKSNQDSQQKVNLTQKSSKANDENVKLLIETIKKQQETINQQSKTIELQNETIQMLVKKIK